MYLGDFAEDTTVRFMWTTNAVAGESITRATNGTVSVYKDSGTTQSTAGVTDTEDFDSLTGVHSCVIDTSADAFYATAGEYTVVLSAATIDGKTINAVLAHFSIERTGGALALLKDATVGLAALETLVDGLEAALAAGVTVTTNNDKTGYRLSATGVDDILDEIVEGSRTVRQYLRGIAAALFGKLSGAATTTVVVRDVDDSKNRFSATVDGDGNRSAVTIDLT